MKNRIRTIPTNLESVRKDLLALSDDIWLSIDHNDSTAIDEGVKFKKEYNIKDLLALFGIPEGSFKVYFREDRDAEE